jgi:putative ABC transport system permease protein
VTYVEAWTSGRVETLLEDGTSGETVQLLAPPVGSKLIEPIILEGRWIQPGDENAIVLSELFYERYPHLKVGDPIRLQVNGDKTDWVVVGFFQFAGKSGGLFAYTDFDTMARLTHTPGKSFVYRVVGANGTGANSLPLNEQEALGRRIESHLADLGYHVSDIRAGHSLQKSTTDGLNTLTTFLLIMAILMAVVGSIGLMGTMSLNVMERTREIGILRAIGASDKAIMNMVIVEGMIIGLVSWLLGCLIAIPITQLMSDQISMAIFSTSATFTFTLSGILIWLLAVIVLSILASVIPARSAARLTIREVLAYE